MMNHLLFLIIGAVEWVLAIFRVNACVDGRAYLASILVITETILGLWVLKEYTAGNNAAGVAYAIGAGLGTYISVKFKKEKS